MQSRWGGPFDSSAAEALLPFLTATMDHEKRSLRTKAQQMWHATFANSLKTAEIPKEVAEILRKSLLLSSESSQGRLFDLKHRSESLCTLKDEPDVHKMSGFLYPSVRKFTQPSLIYITFAVPLPHTET